MSHLFKDSHYSEMLITAYGVKYGGVRWKSVTARAPQAMADMKPRSRFQRLAVLRYPSQGACMSYMPTTSDGTVSNGIQE